MPTKNKDAFEKSYRMRVFKGNVAVSVPPEVIRREAKRCELSVEEFIKQYELVAQFNSFEGIHYQFRQAEKGDGNNGKI
jgi:energy-converting hydrogenase A subunit M